MSSNLFSHLNLNVTSLCTQIQSECAGANQQYADQAACETFLNSIPLVLPGSFAAGNSVTCRSFHELLARSAPHIHCRHVGPILIALFAGLFLERIATLVESTHYPEDPPGRPLTAVASLATAIQFAIVVLAVNLIALPFLLIGVGAMVLLVANAYLLSREFFDMASLRHLPRDTDVRLRQKHAREIFMAGLLPAAVALLPLANLVVPVFSTAYFTPLVKSILRSEERVSSAQTGRGRG